MQQHKRRAEDGEGNAGAAGRPVEPHPEASEPVLALEDAKIIHDLYLSGGASRHIILRRATLRDITRYRAQGWIDTIDDRGKIKARLTPRGLQLLAQALKVIAAAPASR